MSILVRLRRQMQRLVVVLKEKQHYWYGIEVAVLQNAIEKYIYVVAYTTLKRYHDQYYYNHTSNTASGRNSNHHAQHDDTQKATTTMSAVLMMMMMDILYGYMAQWVHLPITIPLDTWKTQIQIYNCTTKSNKYVTSDPKWEILYHVLYPHDNSHDGSTATTPKKHYYFPMQHLYFGISSYLITCWKPAIQYTIYESIKRLRIQRRQQQRQFGTSHPNHIHHTTTTSRPTTTNSNNALSWMESFLIAIIARTISTIIIYPYIQRRILQLQLQSQQQQQQPQKNQAPSAIIIPNTSSTMSTTNTECVANENDNDETQVQPKKQQPPLQTFSWKFFIVLLHRQQPKMLLFRQQWIRSVLQ